MLQIEIDGKELSVEQGSTVIEAALKSGTYIPHFCYHKKLSIAANCRMCLVEVEKQRKPLPACATPVTDGMKVFTQSSVAKNAQKGVMEFLLINHPLDCPICDQGGECQLQDLSVGYGKSTGRYEEAKRSVIGKDMGPLVSAAEMSRCIHCTRCVRFTDEIAGWQELAMTNRGEFSEIEPMRGKTLETELSGNVIDLCPVGALTSKPFRYDARSWELSRRKSISAHDALGSNLIIQVKSHQVRRVLPLENEAINECWLSDRDRFAYEGLNHAERLAQPMIKHGGEWHETDWQTALAYVAKGLKGVAADHGANAISVFANANSTVEELLLAKQLAAGLGVNSIDTRMRQQDFSLDAAQQGALWLGQSINDFGNSNAVLVVGSNLRQEQPLLTARIRQAVKEGMSLSVIASSEQQLRMSAAQHIAHPATWVEVLTQLANPAADASEFIAATAKQLAEGEKTSIVLGADVVNHPQFAQIYAAAQALAVASNSVLGVLPQAANSVGADVIGFKAANNAVNPVSALNGSQKAVMLLNIEPDMDWAGSEAAKQALLQAQTVIALTPFQSESLRELADVMLPVTPSTETSGSFVSMEGRLQSFHGVVKPYAQSRPMWKVLRVIGNELDLDGFDYTSSEEVLARACINSDSIVGKLNNQVQNVAATGLQAASALVRVGGVGIYQADSVVRRSAPLQATVHAAIPAASVHPKTLAALQLTDAAQVVVKSGAASVLVTVVADETVAENVVSLPLHPQNKVLGAMNNAIELGRG